MEAGLKKRDAQLPLITQAINATILIESLLGAAQSANASHLVPRQSYRQCPQPRAELARRAVIPFLSPLRNARHARKLLLSQVWHADTR